MRVPLTAFGEWAERYRTACQQHNARSRVRMFVPLSGWRGGGVWV